MTDPVPVRSVVRRRVTRPHEVIETEQVVEFATPTPAPQPGRELPRGGYDPARDSPLAGTGMELDGCAPARQALPPAPVPAPWWRRWLP